MLARLSGGDWRRRWRCGALTALTLLGLAIAWPQAGRAAETGRPLAITSLSVERAGAGALLRLGLSRPAEFSLFTLDDPMRLVIDMGRFDWRAGAPDPAGLAGISALRHGVFREGVSRIVIELEAPFAVRQAGVGFAGRGTALDILLEPVALSIFRQGAGWPEGARWEPGALPQRAGDGPVTVMIDPGHGGPDPGAAGGGLVEKELVLDFAHLLARRLAETDRLSVVMTREDDRFVPLRERVRLARASGAHLMLSLHTDSLASGEADGASVYTLDSAGTDSAADAFAERENRADVLAGSNLAGAEDDVTRLLIDLARRGSKAESIKLADAILAGLAPRVDLLATRPHRFGNFFVLKAPDLPSALIELGFLSSEADRARLVDPEWRNAMAEGIVAGVLTWVDTASPGFLAPRG